MIIPVKCFTCGNVIANKYEYYISEVRRLKMSRGMDTEKVIYLTWTLNELTHLLHVYASTRLHVVQMVCTGIWNWISNWIRNLAVHQIIFYYGQTHR